MLALDILYTYVEVQSLHHLFQLLKQQVIGLLCKKISSFIQINDRFTSQIHE